MARYIGPKTKIARRFGEPIFGEDKYFERRKTPPGQHGVARKRGRSSEYALQLQEKQKAKFTYGILEKQFFNTFQKATKKKGVTGEILLQFCEARLDNVVFRLGVTPTRSAARQLVRHRHITLNGNLVDIPSYTLKPGDIVGIREKSKSLEVITNSLVKDARGKGHEWLTWNDAKLEGTFIQFPTRLQIPENIKEQLIVELYSK